MQYFRIFSFNLLLFFFVNNSFAQSTGIGTTTPDNSAVLELKSNTKGFLVPRMTSSERTAINNPAEGLLLYQTNIDTGFYYYSGSKWKRLIDTYQSATGTSQNNVFVYMKQYSDTRPDEVWISNFEGTSTFKVQIPDSLNVSDDACLSPDGKIVFFNAYNLGNVKNIYSCFLDGGDLKRIASSGNDFGVEVRTAAGAYGISSLDTSYVFFSREPVPGQHEIWRINLDGSNEQMLNIVLSGDYLLNVDSDGGQIAVITSKHKILFKARSSSLGYSSLFTCSYDGTNVQKIVDRIGTSFDAK